MFVGKYGICYNVNVIVCFIWFIFIEELKGIYLIIVEFLIFRI